MKTVTFVIGDGQVEIEASGFKGGACDAATKAFEDVLGGAAKKQRKSEYFQKDGEGVRINVGGATSK